VNDADLARRGNLGRAFENIDREKHKNQQRERVQ
jgi:hypothetical protein